MNADTRAEEPSHVRVSCRLALPPGVTDDSLDQPVTIRLSIQDVTMLDESSTTVAETVVRTHLTGDIAGPYALEADLLPGRQYAVYAHLDSTGDGMVASGDLVSTRRIPVDAESTQDVQVEVPVQVVD